ncbi:MAG: crossover junction endodeoxyribonuclease RuvC [Dehalococcoidia bacterium]
MRVLGIDPGTFRMGYGVLEASERDLALIECGVLKAPSSLPLEERLQLLHSSLLEVVDQHHPDHMAVEEPFVYRNVRSAMMVGEAMAVAILAATTRGISVSRYAPRQVKQAVTNYGGSDKEQVQEMVRLQLGLDHPPESTDASDAVAVALCHLQRASLDKLLAGAPDG